MAAAAHAAQHAAIVVAAQVAPIAATVVQIAASATMVKHGFHNVIKAPTNTQLWN
jgi:hypothetical protein